MSSRVRHPLKSLVLFVTVCAFGWLAYENRDFFKTEREELLSRDQKLMLREAILDSLENDPCFVAFRGNLNWRPREQRYRLDIEISDGCDGDARSLCQKIADLIMEQAEVPATVIAFDDAGRELGRAVL